MGNAVVDAKPCLDHAPSCSVLAEKGRCKDEKIKTLCLVSCGECIKDTEEEPAANFVVASAPPLGPVKKEKKDAQGADLYKPGEPLTRREFRRARNLKFEVDDEDNAGALMELDDLFEGDIVGVNASQLMSSGSRNAIRDVTLKWNQGIIPYIISEQFTPHDREVIAAAINDYHDNTCIQFVPWNGEEDHLLFVQGIGCHSPIGRQGGQQQVSLGQGCIMKGTIIHELMHSVGFWHEQSRPDRDDHITILWDNVKQNMSFNFFKSNWNEMEMFGLPYDTDSVIHYHDKAFSRNGEVTIESKPPGKKFQGQMVGFSGTDIIKINMLYECPSRRRALPKINKPDKKNPRNSQPGKAKSQPSKPKAPSTKVNINGARNLSPFRPFGPPVNKEKKENKGVDLFKAGKPLTKGEFKRARNLKFDKNSAKPLMISGDLFEGDIVGVRSSGSRNAVKNRTLKWNYGIVPYIISVTFTSDDREIIAAAINDYHDNTCIQFVPWDGHEDYLFIYEGIGCGSSVGRQEGQQELSLGEGCVLKATIIHELMHTIGFWHEQSRPDRDEHITILWENIKETEFHNFEKRNLDEVELFELPYDTESVMHYINTAFSKNGNLTIESKPPGKQFLGQVIGFSETDIIKINLLYECPTRRRSLSSNKPDHKQKCHPRREPPGKAEGQHSKMFKPDKPITKAEIRKGQELDAVSSAPQLNPVKKEKTDDKDADMFKAGEPLTRREFRRARNLKFDKDSAGALMESGDLFEGDIVGVNPSQFMSSGSRNAIRDETKKWNQGIVPYIISDEFSPHEREVIAAAINDYHDNTCIQFVPWNGEADRVLIYRGIGCNSLVGRQGGEQLLSLDVGCVFKSAVIHELMHSIGFWHEQSRPDRDEHITILWDNVNKSMIFNFFKSNLQEVELYGLPYDTDSVMHYPDHAFSVNGSVTIESKPPGKPFRGEMQGFSKTDFIKINRLYKCPSQSGSLPSDNTDNEQEPHPRCTPPDTAQGQPPMEFIPGDPITQEEFQLGQELDHNMLMTDISNRMFQEEHAELFEGDIMGVDSRGERAPLNDLHNRWPGGVVPYLIDQSFDSQERQIIAAAMDEFHKYTCVRFEPHNGQTDHVVIEKGVGCYSAVGRQEGLQSVSLGPGCVVKSIALHQLMHTAGFWHEHSRPDRDEHVKVLWSNIDPCKRFNFDKFSWPQVRTLGVPYDLGSIMHYTDNTFSLDKNSNLVTIEPREPGFILNYPGLEFSPYDILKINRLYECQQTQSDQSRRRSVLQKQSKDVKTNGNRRSKTTKRPLQRQPGSPSTEVNFKKARKLDTKPCLDFAPSCSVLAEGGQCKEENIKTLCPVSCGECVKDTVKEPAANVVVASAPPLEPINKEKEDDQDADVNEPGEPLSLQEFRRARNLKFDKDSAGALMESGDLFEGDIVGVNASQLMSSGSRNAVRDVTLRWKRGTIPYIISKEFTSSDREIIAAAINDYHDFTCVRFVPRDKQEDHLFIVKGNGCHSPIGRQGGQQKVSLGEGCVKKGTVIHELMHSVGFWHEQSRPDRDKYISIIWDNVKPHLSSNFDKSNWNEVQMFGLPYDIDSVMHYHGKSFSKNRKPTIVSIPPGQRFHGQRKGFSETDKLKINRLYECHSRRRTLSTEENGDEEEHHPRCTPPPTQSQPAKKTFVPGKPITQTEFQNSRELDHTMKKINNRMFKEEHAELFEGDITSVDSRGERNASKDLHYRWPEGVVPYLIDKSFNSQERQIIAAAMDEFHKHTCVRFEPHTGQIDHVVIEKGVGCYSAVGRQEGLQSVSLGPGCVVKSIALHQLMHTAGFWHEHTRPDRDDHVKVLWSNIDPCMRFNFDKFSWPQVRTLGVPYDLDSIMHYADNTFSLDKNSNLVTIEPREPGKNLNNTELEFSPLDILKINRLYECQEKQSDQSRRDAGEQQQSNDGDPDVTTETVKPSCNLTSNQTSSSVKPQPKFEPGEPLTLGSFRRARKLDFNALNISKKCSPRQLGDFGYLARPPTGSRNARHADMLWPNGVIPYVIERNYTAPERDVIAAAIDEYTARTCVRFVPRTVEIGYLFIVKSNGCWSNAGYYGEQTHYMSLGEGCVYTGPALHEFMHTVGFWHEHTRPDRDEYVQILDENIDPCFVEQFKTQPSNEVQMLGEYDTESIMHYTSTAYSINGKPTILSKKPGAGPILERLQFTDLDILKINRLYNCPQAIPQTNRRSSDYRLTWRDEDEIELQDDNNDSSRG